MDSKNWYAWINLMPPKPDDFHVVGEVFVSNPGVQAELTMMEPQGSNQNILMLELNLVQRPGMWTQNMTWVQCRYDKIMSPDSQKYLDVSVFQGGAQIATMKVNEIS